MTFGEKLQFLRRINGISQEELAEQLEVSRQAVSKWENGTSVPDSSKVVKLSRMFSVSTDYLLLDEIEELPTAGTAPDRGQSQKRSPSLRKKFLPAILAGTGALGHFVIYILSRVIAVPVPWTSVDASGKTWWHYNSGHTGHSYKYFVAEYDLQFLLFLFTVLLAVGLLFLILHNMDAIWRFAQSLRSTPKEQKEPQK